MATVREEIVEARNMVFEQQKYIVNLKLSMEAREEENKFLIDKVNQLKKELLDKHYLLEKKEKDLRIVKKILVKRNKLLDKTRRDYLDLDYQFYKATKSKAWREEAAMKTMFLKAVVQNLS